MTAYQSLQEIKNASPIWVIAVEQHIERLQPTTKELTDQEANGRIKRFGTNQLYW